MSAGPDSLAGLELGYDIPAHPGMALHEVVTPCLVVDLDALESNLRRMKAATAAAGVRLRPHGKMHKSVDIARLQHEIGGAQGICAQKVSEAEAFVRGGVSDVLITNEVRQPVLLARLARLARDARITVCVDAYEAVDALARAAQAEGTEIAVLVELEAGGGRCGVTKSETAVALARRIVGSEGLSFAGLQAYRGNAQHIASRADRAAAIAETVAQARIAAEQLAVAGLAPATITGGGTGSWQEEAASGVFTEVQCGSYAFMDADYGRIEGADAPRLDAEWHNALCLLTSVMSHNGAGRAVVDAGLKVQSVDSGLPQVFGRTDVTYAAASDEHGIVHDPANALDVGEKLLLVPGHCDPTCNLHDWYVGLRGDRVECLWPVSARGKAY